MAIHSLHREPTTGVVSLPKLTFAKGTYAYKWTVTDETGKKWSLGGISERLGPRLAHYISTFNTNDKYRLSPLVKDPKNTTQLEIFGPYGKDKDPKTLEVELIASIPKEECLNRTKGGNGGGPWSPDKKPSVSSFGLESPVKYYPFKRKAGDHIAAEISPIKGSAVYVVLNTKTGDKYVGRSTHVQDAIANLASTATHHPKTPVTRAIHGSPTSHVVGLLPSTKGLTPKSLREASKFHIKAKKPKYNATEGGGGPAPMRKLDFSDACSSTAEAPLLN